MFSGTVKLSRSPRIPSAMARIDTSAAGDGSAYACLIRANGSALGYAPTPADVGVGLIELVPAITTGNGFAVGDEVAIYEAGTTADGVAVAIGIASFRVVANDIDDVAGYIDTEVASILTDVADIQARLPAALTAGGNMKVDVLKWNGLTTVELPLVPATAGRKALLTAAGSIAIDWANVENVTTTHNFSGTTILNVTDLATTLATLDTEIDAIQADIDTLQADAAAGLTAVEAAIAALDVGNVTAIDGVALVAHTAGVMPAELYTIPVLLSYLLVGTSPGASAIALNEPDASLRRIYFTLVDTLTGTRLTGATIATFPTFNVTKAGGAAVVAAGSIHEIDAADSPGEYYYEAAAGEVDTPGGMTLYFEPDHGTPFSISTPVGERVSASAFVTALAAHNHDPADPDINLGGLWKRQESWGGGERNVATEGSNQRVKYKDRGGTVIVEGLVDPATGARGESDVGGDA